MLWVTQWSSRQSVHGQSLPLRMSREPYHRYVRADHKWCRDAKAQSLRACADHIVTGTLGYDDAIVRLNCITDAIDPDFSRTAFDAEKLVAVVMDFFADLIPGLDRHEDELQVVSGIEHAAKVVVVFRQLLDVIDKALHDAGSVSEWDGMVKSAWLQGFKYGPRKD